MITNLIIPTFILSVLALFISIAAIVMVLAQKFSTHRIDWKPLAFDNIEDKAEEEFKEVEEEEDKFLKNAIQLSRNKKKEKKDVDPLDNILETANY